MEKDDEDIIQMAESQSTLISRDTFQNRFVVDFPKYPNSSLIFQSQFLFPTINNNFVFKNHEGQYIAKLKKKIQKRIKSQKAEFSVILFTENTEEATLIFTKEKFKLVSKSRVLFEKNYDYSHRFFLDSSRELFFIIHIQKNTSYYLLRAKSSFERDLICNIFCIFKQAYFSDIENFVENQKHFQMIQVSQYHAMVSDLKHIKIMQNFLKKYLLKETQPNDLNTKDENTQNISLSKYTFCVVNSFNEFSSVAKISLEDDFFFIQTNEKQVSFEYTVYSQILPDPDFSIINFHLDKNTFLRLFLHNTEIRENFIQEFSSRRASRIKEIAEKPSVFNCSMISTLGTSPAEIILETGSFTIKNAMQENIQFPYSHLIYLHQKINGQLVFSLDYIQYFLFIFNSSQERLNFIEEFQRRNDKYVSGCFASLFSSFNITIVFKKKNASSARIMILKNTILITTSFGIYTIPYTFEITKSKHDYLHNILLHLENGIMELQFQTNKDMNEFVKLFSNPTHGVRDCSILSTEKEKKNGTELFDDFEKFAQKNSFSSEIVYQRRSITNQSQDNLNTPQNITNQFKDNLNTPKNTFKKSRSLTRTYFDLKLLSQKKENHLENSSNLKQNEENTSFQISIVEENGFIETITITKQKNVLKFETQKRMLIWPIKNIKYKSSVSNQQTILELYYNNEQMTLLFNVEEKMQKFCAILDQENELKSTQILNQDDFPVYYFIVNVLNSKFHLIQKAVKVEIGFESIKCQFNPNEKIFRFNDNLQTQQLDKNSVRILKQSKVLLVASFKKQKQMKKFLKIFELVSSNQFNQGIFHVNFMLEFRKAGKITFLKNQIQFEIFDQKYEFKYNKLKLFQDKNELKKIRIQFKKKDFITEFSSFEEKNLFLRMIKKYYVFQN
ncbi:hypothetical protein M0811_09018 [Anaeramoeba ignava]|uniref:Uncharacterized protein n=1 Tax=Anaeramoeba ignava TaxID=1746090 RepID=A0A9Q0RB16_ANAIG|nr:hypothetical protein M0811_09018 [Anaeramoeba ignava]